MFIWTSSEAIVLPIALIVAILIALVVSFLTRKKGEVVRRIPLMVL